jgi:hypothetical protein
MALGIELDFETADRITVATMKEQHRYLLDDVILHEKTGKQMHPEDYHDAKVKLIPALELLIKYFGG